MNTQLPTLQAIYDSLGSLSLIQQAFSDWQKNHFPPRAPEFFALELCGEAGEVANDEKKLWKGREVSDEQLADEAADVFIALVNYANSRNLDLRSAVAAKTAEIERIRLDRAKQGLDY